MSKRTKHTTSSKSTTLAFTVSLLLSHAIRGLLIALLLSQGVLIGLLYYYKNLPVPNFLIKQLHLQFENRGITFTSKSIKVDLSGELLMENAKFYHNDFTEPLITADLAVAEFSWLLFIIGHLSIDRIRIAFGVAARGVAESWILCPFVLADSGQQCFIFGSPKLPAITSVDGCQELAMAVDEQPVGCKAGRSAVDWMFCFVRPQDFTSLHFAR